MYRKKTPQFVQLSKYAGLSLIYKTASESPRALKLWLLLAEAANRIGVSVVSQCALKKALGVKTRQTVYKAIKYLVKNRCITVGKLGVQNVYILNPNLMWQTAHNSGKQVLGKNNITFPGNVTLTKKENRSLFDKFQNFSKHNSTGSVDLSKVNFDHDSLHHGKINKTTGEELHYKRPTLKHIRRKIGAKFAEQQVKQDIDNKKMPVKESN